MFVFTDFFLETGNGQMPAFTQVVMVAFTSQFELAFADLSSQLMGLHFFIEKIVT